MAEETYNLKFELDDKTRKEMAQDNLDQQLESELARELPDAQVRVRLGVDTLPGEQPDKEVVLIILASGVTASLVGNAVTRILIAWRRRKGYPSGGGSAPPYEDKTTYKVSIPGAHIEVSAETKG
jgi:hypothetical protein